jgi:hypothetical protein
LIFANFGREIIVFLKKWFIFATQITEKVFLSHNLVEISWQNQNWSTFG